VDLNAFAMAPSAAVAALAGAAVLIVGIALRGTAPPDRAPILRAIADLTHAVRRPK
jgi:hypothetical protein